MKRHLIKLLIFLFIGALVGAVSIFYVLNAPASSTPQEIIFEVQPGSFKLTANRLKQAGLIKSEIHFRMLARLMGITEKVRVGEYKLSPHMTPAAILEEISTGRSIQRTLTISEGSNIYEIAGLFEQLGISKKESFLKLCFDKNFLRRFIDYEVSSCEGYVFPETYSYTKYSTVENLLSEMISTAKVRFKDQLQLGTLFGLTPHQVVTLASIVEKETGADDERPLVSSVYHNRLRLKMRLQADPTTLYGKMVKSGKVEHNISRQDLKNVNSYNTYGMAGLPIGPIANPGLESIKAAVNPAKTEYLYFVSQNDGRHVFSKTFKSHNSAVTAFQKNAAARKGKSWRDLNKNKNAPKTKRATR